MSPDFPTAAHSLAAALLEVFPDLSFAPDADAGTLVISAGGLTLTLAALEAPSPEALAPEPAGDSLAEATRAGAYAGESRYVATNGAAARSGYRARAHQDQRAEDQAGTDFMAVAEGELSGDAFRALSQARIQAQNRMLAQPQDPELRASYDALQRRWAAEIKAHRAAEPPRQVSEPTPAEVYPRATGYQGD
jgi:hypothetical protein